MDNIALMREIAKLQLQIDALRTIEVGGVWTAYTPTITAYAGAFTTVSATGYYSKIAKVVPILITVTITTNGTASGIVFASLPFATDKVTTLSGRENSVTGKMLQGLAFNNLVTIYNYDGSYPGGNGYTLYLSGFLSIA